MGNIPTVATKYVFCAKATISDGTNAYVCIKNLHMKWGYELKKEVVIGSQTKVFGTGAFDGAIEFDFIQNTDESVHGQLTPASSQIATTTYTIAEIDTQASPTTRTWTVATKINNFELTHREDDFILAHASGEIISEPSHG